ncbi:hypothetical protein PRIPAC_82160 [Pristionchus pacificus]|uniref:Uncharacterized protein n=1 Tax=Pristionchus pacificus TaxID=54126 RepID=A0A2A6CK61_PRIPA|nr:hypothetical protein PRIPAC_82160 [Pristionchus pacificus]|eukprot:PDM78615.1 hypothetical protein PRIPAC_31194 [Pristionchus pacificus]
MSLDGLVKGEDRVNLCADYNLCAVVDLVMVAASFVPLRCTVYPMMNFLFVDSSPSTYWRPFLSSVTFMCPFTQDLLNCFIALNRVTAIARPFEHVEFFRPVNYLRVPLGEYDIYFPDGSVHIFPWYDVHHMSAVTQLIIALTEGALYCLAYRLLRRTVAKHQDRVILRFGVISLLVSCPGIILQTIPAFEISKSSSPSPIFIA